MKSERADLKGGLRFLPGERRPRSVTCEEVVVQVSPWRCGVVRIEGEHEVIVKLRGEDERDREEN